MKKKLLYTFALIITVFAVYTVLNQESDAEITKKKHAEFLENHPYNESLKLTKKERKAKGMAPNKYFEQEYLLEMNPNTGRTHPENYIEVQQELKANRKLQRVPGDATDNMWVERGPNNVGGRTRAVLFDPNDTNNQRVFAGGVSGGLWVNDNIILATSSWTQVTNGITENLSISCITVDPNNSQIMYIGTGESYTGDDAVGNGVWKSTDGGSNWTNVYSDTFNADVKQRLFYINDIVAWNNPTTNKTEVFIGVAGAYYSEGREWVAYNKTGLYKSDDDGANWSKLALNTTEGTPYEPNDIEIGADNSIWIGTERNPWGNGGGTILKSTDGNSFTKKHTIPNGRRVELAVSKTNKDKIYALCHISGAPVMLVTTDSFANTTNITTPADADTGIPNTDFTRGQSWYDLVIEVDPTNDNIIYAGGIDLFRSVNSGGAWKQISKWSNNNNLAALTIPTVHADQHGWMFHPTDPNKALIGNDGGVFYANSLSGSETTTSGIQARIGNYNVTQFYHGEIGQSTTNKMLLAGAQDNGTQFINGANAGINQTIRIRGGDGAYSFIDKDGGYAIAAYVYNNYRRYPLPYNGSGVTTIVSESGTNTGSFINPADLDDNLNILYTNGTVTIKDLSDNDVRKGGINRFTNLTSSPATKFLLQPDQTNTLLNADATVLKVSPFTTTSTKLFVGTSNGKLLKVENANSSPVWSNISGASFSGSISAIQFGATENDIMVTFHNYGVTSIWYSANGGTSWTSKEGNFPDIPVKAIMMNPLDTKEVIIGTQLGVWRTGNFEDASPTWSQSYNGMSDVKVTSFSLRTADNTVMATTYGRGMFTGQFSTGTASVDEVVKDQKVFTMYPTVSSGDFTIFAKNTLGKADLRLFNINGKQVFSKKIDFTQQEKQPVSVNLSSGVYIVNLIDADNRKSIGKVIIK